MSDQMDLTYTEHSIQKQQDTHYSQTNMKHFLGYMMLGHKTNQQKRLNHIKHFFLLTTMVWKTKEQSKTKPRENGNKTYKNLQDTRSSSKREARNDKCLCKETRSQMT